MTLLEALCGVQAESFFVGFRATIRRGDMQIWFLWLKHRWQAISALGIVLLVLLLVVLMIAGTSTFGMTLLGNASAPRVIAANGPSGTVLPRSSDPNQYTSALPDGNTSLLDQAIAADTGPHTVAEAQAAWSTTEMEQHQAELLAAMNCARQQHQQRALTLDPHLSATASDAWLTLSRDRSFSLMHLPGRYALRSVMPLTFGTPSTSTSTNQTTPSGPVASHCTVGGFDMTTLVPTTDATRIGIAVFPPQASWDMASAVVLVQ
jgi:hypothetical protein